MPSVEEAKPEHVIVDVELMAVGVNMAAAVPYRAELIEILKTYPDDGLSTGPSYMTVGAVLGHQEAALHLFALGKMLGFWEVITPSLLGVTGEEARGLARAGYVMITGFRPGI